MLGIKERRYAFASFKNKDMYMMIYRTMIVVGQLGRIWSKGYHARRIYQTMTAVGFYALMTRTYRDREEWANDQLMFAHSPDTTPVDLLSDKNVKIKFKTLSKWE